MNSSIYIFGNMQQGYTQYPDDETTHEIFQNFALSAKAPTQLAIHRDGSLMYYGYIRKLIGEQYIGLCVLLNGHMVNDITALFSLFERTMEQLAEQGYLIKFDTDGSLIANTDHLYMSKTEVDSVSYRLQQEFESLDGCITTLPPVNYTQSMDSVGTFNFSDDTLKIVESTHNNGYTYVYKRKGFNTATMDSYRGVLAAVNDENEALKKQIEALKAGDNNTFPHQATKNENKKVFKILISATIVIALIVGGVLISTKDKEEYATTDHPDELTFTVEGVNFTMRRVEGGSFEMGATIEQESGADNDEWPVHSVTVNDYYMGETEVTQALWYAVMGTTVYEQRDYSNLDWPVIGEGPNYPMYYISYDECQQFVRRLSDMTNQPFRIPTEAEWEFAARGGLYSQGYRYSGSNSIGSIAWYQANSNKNAHAVKMLPSNELGLYDMTGNLWEWCYDWYGEYGFQSQQDPSGPAYGSKRVFRGGAWYNDANNCRIANRIARVSSYRDNGVGFRLAL